MAELLVVGLSARALAQAARRAGFRPLAVDFFGDSDLDEAAETAVRIEADFEQGFQPDELLAAVERAAEGRSPAGIVCGTGFEDRPALLDALAGRWPLLGNSAAAVARAKDPATLAELCAGLDVPHPGWSGEPVPGWLGKRRGGSGGGHVRPSASPPDARLSGREEGRVATTQGGEGEHWYWQEPVAGEPVSALTIGDGAAALVLGFSDQWPDPAPGAPFRYGGAVRPASLSAERETELGEAARRIVVALGLVGLNSVDFLVGPEGWALVEVNPRPGATLDVFDAPDVRLLGLHVEACRGRLPERPPRYSAARAAAIVYARRAIGRLGGIAWPDWAADRQRGGSRVPSGAPLCTVLADAADAAGARRLAKGRAADILAALEAA